MNLVTLDFETYWSDTHTLRKMSNIEYVMHPDTEIISCSIKINGGFTEVWFGENQIRPAFADIDWDDTMVIGHNMSEFDALVLAWRFGIRPKMWGCTMAMARPIHAKTTGLSLGALVQHYGIGVKDNTALVQTKGKRLKEFDPFELEAMRRYNKDDTEQCYALFHELRKHYTAKELVLIDMTIRAMVEPKFLVDHTLLEQVLDKVRANKKKQLVALAHMIGAMRGKEFDLIAETLDWYNTDDIAEYVRAELASAPKFSAMLEKLGVEVPTKPSPTNPEKMIPALSKTDEGFIELQSHPDPLVSMAAGARLGVKSVQLETRIETFLKVCDATEGYLPVPLKYCGADTTGRWSGYQYNPQNLPRINPNKRQLSDALRLCMQAPAGSRIIVADQSGIELRVNHFLWKVESSMALYRADPQADLYRAFAAARYGISPEEVDKSQRQLAKVCVLEGTLVLTDRGEVPIEQVTSSDRVWDGVEWVGTLGAIYKGERDVITYDGLTATPDHYVWVEDGRKVQLAQAAAQSLRLARTGEGGTPLGFGEAGVEGASPGQRIPAGAGLLHGVWHEQVGELRQPAQRENAGVPIVQAEMRGTEVVVAPTGSGEAALHQPERLGVPAVRPARHTVPVPVGGKSGGVGGGEPRPAGEHGAGSDRQQRPLRTGEFAVGVAASERGEPARQQECGLSSLSTVAPGCSVRGQHTAQPAARGDDIRPDRTAVGAPVGQAKGRVWDLLNCGPRHRFTAGGRLVSNCQLGLGFGAGSTTFVRIARVMGGIELQEVDAQELVLDWRREYAGIVNGWRTCQDALGHIVSGREREIDPWGLCHTSKHGIHLPSGRIIRYPNLRREDGENGRAQWVYGDGRHRAFLSGPKVDENIVQALARDTVADNAVEFRQLTGLSFSLMVHDELAYVVPKEEAVDKLHTLQTIMRTPPKWWPELVTWSEGDSAPRYGLAK